jgi:hypothetical protein
MCRSLLTSKFLSCLRECGSLTIRTPSLCAVLLHFLIKAQAACAVYSQTRARGFWWIPLPWAPVCNWNVVCERQPAHGFVAHQNNEMKNVSTMWARAALFLSQSKKKMYTRALPCALLPVRGACWGCVFLFSRASERREKRVLKPLRSFTRRLIILKSFEYKSVTREFINFCQVYFCYCIDFVIDDSRHMSALKVCNVRGDGFCVNYMVWRIALQGWPNSINNFVYLFSLDVGFISQYF